MFIVYFRLGAELDGDLKAESKGSPLKGRGEGRWISLETALQGSAPQAAHSKQLWQPERLHSSTSESWFLKFQIPH